MNTCFPLFKQSRRATQVSLSSFRQLKKYLSLSSPLSSRTPASLRAALSSVWSSPRE